MTRKNAYMVVTMITTRVPVAATAVRTGRGSVANSGCKPEDAPCQAEETDHFFIRSSVNYRTNKEPFQVIEGTSVKRSGAKVQLLTLINKQRSSQVGVRASKKAEENRENMNF